MTITLVGTGTAATAVNASVTPGLPTGTAVGDLVLIHASTRSGTVNVPAGWASVYAVPANEALLGKFWTSTDTMPTVTFTGSVAGDDTIAQSAAFRGVAPEVLTGAGGSTATLSNASAQNIAYPGSTITQANRLVLMWAWKQDDATSIATPAGWTSLGFTSPTVGNDATNQWYYQVQTTATTIVAGSLVVTGGAAAISRGAVTQMRVASQLTATLTSTVYPPRVVLAASQLDTGQFYTISRIVAGVRTPVRGANGFVARSSALVVVDAELPFGAPVTYALTSSNGLDDAVVGPTTYALPGGKVAITDATQGSAAETVVLAWDPKTYDTQNSVFVVDGKNLVVTSGLGQYTSSVQLYTETTAGNDALAAVLATASGGIVQVRQAGGYDGVDAYWNVLSASQARFSQDGSDQRRVWTLNVAEVDGWSGNLAARGFTYADLDAAYLGLTYAQWKLDYPTYLAAAQGDYS